MGPRPAGLRSGPLKVLLNLSEIVLEEELATKDELRKAARLADRADKPLVEVLVRELDLDEVALVRVLAQHTKTEVVDPAKLRVDPDAMRQVAKELCTRLKVMPLSVSLPGKDQTLRIAVADPTDAVGLAELEHVCSLGVDPVLTTLSAIEELIHKSYRELITEVMQRRPNPFGGDHDEATAPAKPTTQPHHRIADEATTAILLEATIKLLKDKNVFTDEELDESVLRVLRERSDDG